MKNLYSIKVSRIKTSPSQPGIADTPQTRTRVEYERLDYDDADAMLQNLLFQPDVVKVVAVRVEGAQ